MFIFPVQLTMSKIGNLTRLIHTLLYVMTIHTYTPPAVALDKVLSLSPQNSVSYKRAGTYCSLKLVVRDFLLIELIGFSHYSN